MRVCVCVCMHACVVHANEVILRLFVAVARDVSQPEAWAGLAVLAWPSNSQQDACAVLVVVIACCLLCCCVALIVAA